VKLDKLVKTLHREIVANPAKAGLLGVLLLAGLYFWGPLVRKWVGGNQGAVAVTPSAAAAVPVVDAASQQSAGALEQDEFKLNWSEVRQRREKDPLTRAADFQPSWNQAFLTTAIVGIDPSHPPADEGPVTPPAIVDPAKLGLVLEGVVIGSKFRRAIISGKVYREQDQITVKDTPASQQAGIRHLDIVYRLVHVSRKMVELEREGKTWRLEIGGTEPVEQPLPAGQATAPQKENESPSEKVEPFPGKLPSP
jgi:hypothetical protein